MSTEEEGLGNFIKGMEKEPIEFDLFCIPVDKDDPGPTLEAQREFELWWHKTTGRRAIVVAGVDFKTTLQYRI